MSLQTEDDATLKYSSDHSDHTLRVYALSAIKKDQQVLSSYVDSHITVANRSRILYEQWRFVCHCVRCSHDKACGLCGALNTNNKACSRCRKVKFVGHINTFCVKHSISFA